MASIKKVLFVSPFPRLASVIMEASQLPPIGLAYTAAYLEEKGIECRIIDANLLKLDEQSVFQQIEEFDPDLVGISFNIATVREVILLSNLIKEKLGKYVILGGPSSSGDLEEILRKSKADCIVKGEGEVITWNLISSRMDLKNVKGIAYLDNGKMVTTPPEEKIQNVDSIPFPAYHLLPPLSQYKNRSRKHPIAPMVTERGCPYACTFCGSARTGFRARSPENVIAEIEYLQKRFGVKQIDILDDNFTFDLKRAEKIMDLIIEHKIKIHITFPNGLRADRLTPELVRKMRKGGVYRAGIGIESGDQRVVDGVKKSLKLEQVRDAMIWLRKEGITIFGYFQLGLPGETIESMQKTIDFAKEINPHWANFGITTPLPGTELYNNLKAQGKLFYTEDEGIERGFYSIKEGQYIAEGLTPEKVMTYQQKAWKEFYFRPSKMVDVLSTIRSIRELQWTISLAWPIFKGLFKKQEAN